MNTNGRPPGGGLLPSESRVIAALLRTFPDSKLSRVPTVERGVLYLNAERREVLAQVRTISHEDGRSDDEARALLSRAGVMAAEQLLARKAR